MVNVSTLPVAASMRFRFARAMFGYVDVEPSVVFAPDDSATAAAAWRALIASDAAADIEVITCGQILWRRARFSVRHKQIGLCVRLHGFMRDGATECDAFAVVAKSVIAHPAFKGQQLSLVAAVESYRIQIGARGFIVGLGDAARRQSRFASRPATSSNCLRRSCPL